MPLHRARSRTRALLAGGSVLAASLVGLATTPVTPSADAAQGVLLRQFTAQVPRCPINTGVAFDGDELVLSCWYSNKLYFVSPEDGRLLRTVAVTGVSGMGALAYDKRRDTIWACDVADESVVRIPGIGTADGPLVATRAFRALGGCIDGLAYDGTDDTLFTSGDVASEVFHYRPDGARIDVRDVSQSLGECGGSSGIAVGGAQLFLANNGCSEIYTAGKTQDSVPSLFASFPRRIEDLECDDVTFRVSGKSAIWAMDAYDTELQAFEIPGGDCGFGGQAPDDGNGEQFVVVAFGDSYQSGEGVGNSISNAADYRAQAYENGSNYPAAVGGQQDTLTDAYSPGGNSCHRSLANYAKINRDKLEPGADVVLVDVTCSGAKIVKDGKPGITGLQSGNTVDSDSQVQQALDRLGAAGLDADDVDLVTVGMGGNDAKFGEIVQACLLPNMARRLLAAYPDAPGEIEFLANQFATCENVDRYKFKTDEAIEALEAKELTAQRKILAAFPEARVLQLDYPDSLPDERGAPSWCGGIRKEDLNFAKGKIDKIDDAIRSSISTNRDRIELVEVQHVFGSNGLCPGSAALTLANGFSETNFELELSRLLNLDGTGDARARRGLDELVEAYQDAKDCYSEHYTPFGDDCDTGAANERVTEAGEDLLDHLETQIPLIQANVIAPSRPGGDSVELRGDRSRGLFHPNANGFAAVACQVLATYRGFGGSNCEAASSPYGDTINGRPVTNSPFSFANDFEALIGGFDGLAPIRITVFSERRELGTVQTDADGVLRTSLALPQLEPGVHTLLFQGETETGAAIHKRVRIAVPGRPAQGGSWATYLTGFSPRSGVESDPEQVEITWLGDVVATMTPDEDGGLFVQLPLYDLPSRSDALVLSARSLRTGKVVTTTVDPVPTVPGLWATTGELSLGGSDTQVQGRSHAGSDLVLAGNGHVLTGGSEYAGALRVAGKGHATPGARRVTTAEAPALATAADYRPGSPASTRPGWSTVSASACKDGTWTVRADQVPAGVVHVPCGVHVTGGGVVRATLVAEGPVRFSGSGLRVDPGVPGAPSVVTASTAAEAVRVSGADVVLVGTVSAPAGGVSLTGARGTYRCGVQATTISVRGSGTRVPVEGCSAA